jgi:hypothetical protein
MGSTLRFAGIVAILFLTVFFGGKWLLEERPLKPDPRLPNFQRVNPEDPRIKLDKTSVSDDDPTRDRLRKEALDYAKPLRRRPVQQDPAGPLRQGRHQLRARLDQHRTVPRHPDLRRLRFAADRTRRPCLRLTA